MEKREKNKRRKTKLVVEEMRSSLPHTEEEQKLVEAKFSKKEDQVIKDAVEKYIKVHGLGENGLHMVLHCIHFPETIPCWDEIGTLLPRRHLRNIYWRAHKLFTKGEQDSWTAEAKALITKLLRLDACSVEDVDWDNLIDQRSGEVCLKRWKQMCLQISNHGIKPFTEQVEVLASRYLSKST